jgi:histidyl-tRNA synthetase
MGRGHLVASRATPTCVLIALNDLDHISTATQIATELRSRGIPAEVFGQPLPYGKQIQYAEKKGIPYVWFHNVDGDEVSRVRDLASKEQSIATPGSWMPEPSRLHPSIIYTPPKEV